MFSTEPNTATNKCKASFPILTRPASQCWLRLSVLRSSLCAWMHSHRRFCDVTGHSIDLRHKTCLVSDDMATTWSGECSGIYNRVGRDLFCNVKSSSIEVCGHHWGHVHQRSRPNNNNVHWYNKGWSWAFASGCHMIRTYQTRAKDKWLHRRLLDYSHRRPT